MAFIEVRNLSKKYLGISALREVSLFIEKGEFLCLMGPSGSGKTTFLRLLNLLEEPTSGEVIFDTTDITKLSNNARLKIRRRMGMVFQRPVVFNTSVYDNVAYGLKIRGLSSEYVDKKVNEAIALVGLSGLERRMAITLSGGEAQRVALARAMVIEPELLLLDEATANLDPRNVAIIENVVSQINKKQDTTVVMATHNLYQAKRLADRAAFLLEGAIVEIGKAEDVFTRPQDKRTEAFIKGVMIF